MFARVLLTAFLITSILCGAIAQQPQPSPSQKPATTQQQPPPDIDSQDVVRITTNLVQVDAVVTKDGRQVTNLRADDFELFEDGKPQAITNFSYVSNVPANAPAQIVSTRKSNDKDKTLPVPPAKINLNDQRRTVALVIDDLGISFESMGHIRSQIRKFLDQLSPTDLVAIVRTGGDVGSLQQFTNDKRLLQSALDHLHWNPCSRAGLYVFPRPGAIGDYRSICSQYVLNGTLKSVQFILKGMGQLPGRKSMVLFSDFLPIEDQESQLFGTNIRIQPPGEQSEPLLPDAGISYSAQLHRIAELAIRSAVVIYSVDTRGLQTTGLTAADRLTATTEQVKNQEISSILSTRSAMLLRGREGSDLIAKQTGGFLIRNSNDFGLKDIMQDQEGYYLIGFRPAEETFDRKFHQLKAKLKRRGLELRTRAGFYGFTDEEARPTELSATDLVNKALISPFGAKDIDLRLTSFFVDDPAQGAVLRSFVYFHPRDLTFAEQPDGWRLANVDVKAILFGDNGRVVGQQEQAGSLRYKGAGYERAMREGVTYSFDIPVKMRGAFQFRVAVRDVPTARIGAAGQFVELPDLRNGRLALSGVVAREEENKPNDQRDLASSGPAVRRFRQGSNVTFAYAIYNSDAAGRTAELIQQVRLFREGKVVFSGPPTAVSFKGQSDPKRITSAARLQLGPALAPGDYVFQVIVTDSSDKQGQRTASQWIDFEVIG